MNATFRIISSAAGLNATIVYKVSSDNAISTPSCPSLGPCTETGGKNDYGRVFSSDGTRYVADGASGSEVIVNIVTSCATGSYPGSSISVDVPASGGSSAYTSQQASCIACPKDTTTYGTSLSKRDCKCNEGMVDARLLLPSGYLVDETVSPCVAQDIFCGTTSGGLTMRGCTSFQQGVLVSINPGFWTYSLSFALDPSLSAVTWTITPNASTGVVSDATVIGRGDYLRAASVTCDMQASLYLCS